MLISLHDSVCLDPLEPVWKWYTWKGLVHYHKFLFLAKNRAVIPVLVQQFLNRFQPLGVPCNAAHLDHCVEWSRMFSWCLDVERIVLPRCALFPLCIERRITEMRVDGWDASDHLLRYPVGRFPEATTRLLCFISIFGRVLVKSRIHIMFQDRKSVYLIIKYLKHG